MFYMVQADLSGPPSIESLETIREADDKNPGSKASKMLWTNVKILNQTTRIDYKMVFPTKMYALSTKDTRQKAEKENVYHRSMITENSIHFRRTLPNILFVTTRMIHT